MNMFCAKLIMAWKLDTIGMNGVKTSGQQENLETELLMFLIGCRYQSRQRRGEHDAWKLNIEAD